MECNVITRIVKRAALFSPSW